MLQASTRAQGGRVGRSSPPRPFSELPGLSTPAPVQALEWMLRPAELLDRCQQRFGATFRLRVPPGEFIVVSGRADLKRIFAATADAMTAGDVNRSIAGVLVGSQSTIVLDGDPHLGRRRLLLPAFHGERMRFYGETMADITRDALARFRPGRRFALHPPMQDITLEIIVRTVFGADAGIEAQTLVDELRTFLKLGELPLSLLPILYLSANPRVEDDRVWKFLLSRRNRARGIVRRQIERRRAARREGRQDVLSMLLDSRDAQGAPMTDAELLDELMTTLAAGHESTATTLAWCFERILSHPQVLAQLRAELCAAGGPDAPPETLSSLPYLDATIKEVLRQRPVLPFVVRRLQQPTELGGYLLPEHTLVAPCIHLAQRDPAVFAEPQLFRPERFLGTAPDPLSFLPFGGGVRRCVGVHFALYEMKIVLAHVLGRCDLELVDPPPLKALRRSITFWPSGGTRVRLRSFLH
ncbi:MAG: cytochrome P450 [Myxococcales bacterium]|nr:cytochrome P450 [Myxococcales bacterium]